MPAEAIVVYSVTAVLCVGVFVVPRFCGWWFDPDRRPARWHRRECACWNCNDYSGSGDGGGE